MPDAGHVHEQLFIINSVHGAVIAHANAPFMDPAFEFLAATRTRIGSQSFQSPNDAGDQLIGQAIQFLPGAGFDLDAGN